MQTALVSLALLSGATCWQPARRLSGAPASLSRRRVSMHGQIKEGVTGDDAVIEAQDAKVYEQYADSMEDEEAEIMADAERIASVKRSNLFNENGVAYAPWMVQQVDEEAIGAARAIRKDKKRLEAQRVQEKQGVVNILDAATSELSGIGLKANVEDGEVELFWGTNDEEDNKGFLVERKRVGYSEWDEIASYSSWAPLKSKGTLGGAYSYVDVTAEEGEWLYRIVAEQIDNTRAITCQVGVSVESSGQQLQTKIIVGGLGALVVAFLAAGALLDPIKG